VNHTANHSRPLRKATQYFQKIACLSNQSVRRRGGPSKQLTPSLFRRRRSVLPDPGVGDNAQEFVAARPWDSPNLAAFSQGAQYSHRVSMRARFSTVSVNQDIRIYRVQLCGGSPYIIARISGHE